MPDYLKQQLKAVPSKTDYEGRSKLRPLNESGEDFLREGYSVIARADRMDTFEPTLSGGKPVTNDRPTVAYDEDK